MGTTRFWRRKKQAVAPFPCDICGRQEGQDMLVRPPVLGQDIWPRSVIRICEDRELCRATYKVKLEFDAYNRLA